MKKLLFAVIGMCVLAGCSKDLGYIMQTWEGSSINKLTSSWGVPDQTFKQSNGSTVYTWIAREFSSGRYTECKKTFTANSKGIIIDWNYSGYC